MLHTSTTGDKLIKLPGKYNINELFSGKNQGKATSQIIEKNLAKDVTKIYHITPM
jgi:hypothetical protein